MPFGPASSTSPETENVPRGGGIEAFFQFFASECLKTVEALLKSVLGCGTPGSGRSIQALSGFMLSDGGGLDATRLGGFA